jgi:hypothetical protein
VDAVHGTVAAENMATGANHDTFRASITGAGHTIVPLTTFSAAELAGVDAAIIKNNYTQNGPSYTGAQISAIQSFASTTVFVSDLSLWNDADAGSDRPITFGDNNRLLNNIVSFITAGHGVLFVGENGTGFDPVNFNLMTAPYGVQYATSTSDGDGRTVTGFVAHPITSGVTTLGVDFQLPLTITSPALDLTTGAGQDNILAVSVPEPGVAGVLLLGWLIRRRAR